MSYQEGYRLVTEEGKSVAKYLMGCPRLYELLLNLGCLSSRGHCVTTRWEPAVTDTVGAPALVPDGYRYKAVSGASLTAVGRSPGVAPRTRGPMSASVT